MLLTTLKFIFCFDSNAIAKEEVGLDVFEVEKENNKGNRDGTVMADLKKH